MHMKMVEIWRKTNEFRAVRLKRHLMKSYRHQGVCRQVTHLSDALIPCGAGNLLLTTWKNQQN